MTAPAPGTTAQQVVDALLGDAPLPALEALLPRLGDPALRDVVLAAQRRLRGVRLDPAGDAARLLLAVSGHPGRTAAKLAELSGLGDRCAAAAGDLVARGLVTPSRFDRPDCWARTAQGARAVRLLREG